jgi:hypothetical protein
MVCHCEIRIKQVTLQLKSYMEELVITEAADVIFTAAKTSNP